MPCFSHVQMLPCHHLHCMPCGAVAMPCLAIHAMYGCDMPCHAMLWPTWVLSCHAMLCHARLVSLPCHASTSCNVLGPCHAGPPACARATSCHQAHSLTVLPFSETALQVDSRTVWQRRLAEVDDDMETRLLRAQQAELPFTLQVPDKVG